MRVERRRPEDDRGESTFDVRDFGMEPPRILMLKVQPDVVVAVEIIAQERTDVHELGLCSSIVDAIERRASGRVQGDGAGRAAASPPATFGHGHDRPK